MSIEKKYNLIWNEVISLEQAWNIFKGLFCTSKEITDKVNKKLPDSAQPLYRILLHDIIGSIGRLNDPAEQRKNKNASLEQLLNIASEITTRDVCGPVKAEGKYKEVKDKYNTFKEEAKIFLPYRNKLLSHLDQKHALSPDDEVVPRIKTDSIYKVISAIEALMHAFEAYYIHGLDELSHHEMDFIPPKSDGSHKEIDIVILLRKTDI